MLPEIPLLEKRQKINFPPKRPDLREKIQLKNKEIEEENALIDQKNSEIEKKNQLIRFHNRAVHEQTIAESIDREKKRVEKERNEADLQKKIKLEKARALEVRKREIETEKKRKEDRQVEMNKIGLSWIGLQQKIRKLFSKPGESSASDFSLEMDLGVHQDIAAFKFALAKDLYRYVKLQLIVRLDKITRYIEDPTTIEYYKDQKRIYERRAELVRAEIQVELAEAEREGSVEKKKRLVEIAEKQKSILVNLEFAKRQREIWESVVEKTNKERAQLRLKIHQISLKIKQLLGEIPEYHEKWRQIDKL